MLIFLLRFFIYTATGFMIFSLIPKKNRCNVHELVFSVKSAFFEAKNRAIEYGESLIEFQNGRIKISYSGYEKTYPIPANISAPYTIYRACSNTRGTPSIKTSFRFSPKGMKDISGTIYLSCDNEFVAFSVLSPTGGITPCIYMNQKWEEIK